MRKGKDVPELSNAELKAFTQTLNPTLMHLTKTKKDSIYVTKHGKRNEKLQIS